MPPRGGTRTRPAARDSAGGTATPGPRRPSYPQRPPPPPWAVAGPPQGPRRSPGRPVGGGIGAVDLQRRLNVGGQTSWGSMPVARIAVVMPACPYLVNLVVRAGQRRSAPVRRQPIPGGLARRAERHHAAALPRPQRVQPRQPHRGHRGAGRRRGGLRVAAPGGVGRPGTRHPLAVLPRPGASVRGSCRSSTCGCPTPPSATACRRDDPHRPRVLQWWIAWLAAAILSTAAGISALFSTGAALALSIPAALGLPGRHSLVARHRHGHRGGAPGRLGQPRSGGGVRCGADRCGPELRSSWPTVHSDVAFPLPGVHFVGLRSCSC